MEGRGFPKKGYMHEDSRKILRRLNKNDQNLVELQVVRRSWWHNGDNDNEYCIEGALDSEWLGHFIGENIMLQELALLNPFKDFSNSDVESFCKGVNSNRSIQKITFGFMSLSLLEGEIFQSLRPFLKNNNSLSELVVDNCTFGDESARQLSLALKDCSKSLKSVKITQHRLNIFPMWGEQLAHIIEALRAHTQLEILELDGMNIGATECVALTNLLCHTTDMRELNLHNNSIDDEGVESLVGALLANSNLHKLILSYNQITARGCQSLAALLRDPNSNLENICLERNNIRDEGARTLANALTTNRKLKHLFLSNNHITAEGYSSFSKVLCDTSSINDTFLSNHTLLSFGIPLSELPPDVRSSMVLNQSSDDKKQVAIKKILKHHQHFDMQPFFEWELKVLPLAVNWFQRALSVVDYDEDDISEAGIDNQKLGAIYQFIRAMPDVIEPAPAAVVKKRRKRASWGSFDRHRL